MKHNSVYVITIIKQLLSVMVLFSMTSCNGEWLVTYVSQDSTYHKKVVAEAMTNVNAMSVIINVIDDGDKITYVGPIYFDHEIVGYTIDFQFNNSITIYLKNYEEIGHPDLGIKTDGSGKFYWAIDGEFLLDSNKNLIPVYSHTTGKSTLYLGIKDGYWQFSSNNRDWIELCKTTKWLGGQKIFCEYLNIADDRVELKLKCGKVLELMRFYNRENPLVDLNKDNLKILDIGNSYTVDAQSYLSKIINAANVHNDFSLYSAIRGAASYKSWVDCYYDNDSYNTYDIRYVSGNKLEGVAGVGTAYDGSRFRAALEFVEWDIILIHQVSYYANDFGLWQGDGDGGYLNELITIIRQTNPNATIGYLMVHSYADDYNGNAEKSSYLRWKNIANSTRRLKEEFGIDFIIPYGTAVENLRATSLNDGSDFSTDGAHLAKGIGGYVASCCYYQIVFSSRFGKSILENTFRQPNVDESVLGVRPINDTNALLAQKCAILAIYNMWEVTNPELVWDN